MGTCLALFGTTGEAWAQKQLADDLIVIAAGRRSQDAQRDSALGGPGPGGDVNRLTSLSTASAEPMSQPGGAARPYARSNDVLKAAAEPIPGAKRSEVEILNAPVTATPLQVPAGGMLERPAADEEGPSDGLSLDLAVAILADQSLSLKGKFQEIPKATADVLTAGMRANPLLFGSVDEIPYGNYSPARLGEKSYSLTVIQPIDINRERIYRVVSAERARDVLQAQYQNAIRLEIDELQVRFLDAMAARETIRYVDASLVGLNDVRTTVEGLVRGQQISSLELDRVNVQLDAAELSRQEASATFYKTEQDLAAILAMPAPDHAPLEIRGSIRTDVSGLPEVEQMLEIAYANRPDLRAYQLGVRRAAADVDLAVKERYPDIFVLYTPWGITDNSQVGGQNATSWSVSAMAGVPIFNRNQGNIRRAEINVNQTQIEWQQLTRQIEAEVRRSHRECLVAAEKVKRLDESILPRGKKHS